MAIIVAILGSIASTIGSMLKAVPAVVWLAIALVLAGVYIGSSGQGCSCGRQRPPSPPRSFDYAVVSVPRGNTILAKGFGRRSITITLAYIATPDAEGLSEESRANLERLAGKEIRVEVPRSFLADDASGEDVQLEGRRDKIGMVFGESGHCLNLEQLRAGLAKNTGDSSEYVKAEAEAREAKRGVWAAK